MIKRYSNPCVRCGNERIVAKTWEERTGNSVIVNKLTVCPDIECQKRVNSDNKKLYDKQLEVKLRSEQRAVMRKAVNRAEKFRKNQTHKVKSN